MAQLNRPARHLQRLRRNVDRSGRHFFLNHLLYEGITSSSTDSPLRFTLPCIVCYLLIFVYVPSHYGAPRYLLHDNAKTDSHKSTVANISVIYH